jgi:Fur family transcriptional regulator, ferric uptake regulator
MAARIKQKSGVKKILNDSRQRVTAQRALLLELLRRSRGHVDADELYRSAKKRNPRISLSTVYRNLQLFKKMGLVDERHFDEEHHHYEVKSGEEHQHLLCVSCGKVVEFDYPAGRKFRQDIARKYDFDITGVEIHMTGLCSTCRANQRKSG